MITKIILFLGGPGSGKGTQGAMLSKEMLIPHISTGEILRKIVETSSEDVELLKFYMKEGKLVPSDLVNKIVKKYLLSNECKNGCILDGYPRNLQQAEYFIENITDDVVVVYFSVSDELSIKRITGRFSCLSCGRIYNRFFDEPTVKDLCDDCGSKDFIYRFDDDENTIRKRLQEYKLETMPLVEYYKSKNKLFEVDASKSKYEVYASLLSIVKRV